MIAESYEAFDRECERLEALARAEIFQVKHVADPLADRYDEEDVYIRRQSDENREID